MRPPKTMNHAGTGAGVNMTMNTASLNYLLHRAGGGVNCTFRLNIEIIVVPVLQDCKRYDAISSRRMQTCLPH
jgi:hypothetical protein